LINIKSHIYKNNHYTTPGCEEKSLVSSNLRQHIPLVCAPTEFYISFFKD